MTNNDHGGPAFPGVSPLDELSHHGMTLRDWFAGQVIGEIVRASIVAGCLERPGDHDWTGEWEIAFECADTGILERDIDRGEAL